MVANGCGCGMMVETTWRADMNPKVKTVIDWLYRVCAFTAIVMMFIRLFQEGCLICT